MTAAIPHPDDKQKKPEVVDFDNPETHWHRCPRCSTVWAHTTEGGMSFDKRIEIHKCPKCSAWTGDQIDVRWVEVEVVSYFRPPAYSVG